MAASGLAVADGYVPAATDTTNVRDEVFDLALDQRAAGRHRSLVAASSDQGL